jgi:hypothetical protein
MADDEESVVGTSPPPRKSDVLLVLARTGRLTPASTASMTRRLIKTAIAAPPSTWRSMFATQGEDRIFSFTQSSICIATTSS